MRIEFDSTVYRWQARQDSDWYFASVPEEFSAAIAEVVAPFARGFGAVRVEASVGGSRWRTSVFPGTDGRYSLPLKRAVRDAEGLVEDDPLHVRLDILDA
ncbi:DUF1905 domain-containing protein [Microbacterium sp. 10M-3C3]|uniref:DUF1905 domain-containing protein n=1 Tax=Microbacterium sp. 10M-3C3 TaxID=2483401 RepID=UPI000F638410|nr:DUF1905 domain-containing protein [Microbacterium sp. 10M-3C3]